MKKLRFSALAALLLFACTASALMPIRWVADGSKPDAYATQIAQGETRELICTLKNYGAPVAVSDSATATMYYQTNGMGSAYWPAPASVTSNGVITATWSPALDAGAAVYNFALGVDDGTTNRIYTAYGILRMRLSPGHIPNTLPLPRQFIDFAIIDILNAPWATPADIEAATSGVLRVEADTLATVTARGAVTTDALTIDAANSHTNTLGGRLTVLGRSVQSGYLTTASGSLSRADGNNTTASGAYSHTEGFASTSSGDYGYAGGYLSVSEGFFSYARGNSATAIGNYTYAIGPYISVTNEGAWAWNGIISGGTTYGSHGEGTFNINPVDGVDGFWIGEQTLSGWVDSVKAIHADIATNVVYHVVVSNGHWLIKEVQ